MKDAHKSKEKLIAELKQSNEALEREISDRIEAEARLRESNQLLESFFSNIHMLFAYLDTDFNFIRVNEAYAKAGGKTPAFFPGKNHFALYPHEENERIFRNVVASGQSYTAYAKPFVYPEHPERVTYWDWTIQPAKTDSEKVTGLILSLRDVRAEVEARKRTEEYAEELERKNKMLSDFASIASHDLQEPLRKILTFGDRLEASLTDRLSDNERDYQGQSGDAYMFLHGYLWIRQITNPAGIIARLYRDHDVPPGTSCLEHIPLKNT